MAARSTRLQSSAHWPRTQFQSVVPAGIGSDDRGGDWTWAAVVSSGSWKSGSLVAYGGVSRAPAVEAIAAAPRARPVPVSRRRRLSRASSPVAMRPYAPVRRIWLSHGPPGSPPFLRRASAGGWCLTAISPDKVNGSWPPARNSNWGRARHGRRFNDIRRRGGDREIPGGPAAGSPRKGHGLHASGPLA